MAASPTNAELIARATALVAVLLWTSALAMKLTIPYFQKFP